MSRVDLNLIETLAISPFIYRSTCHQISYVRVLAYQWNYYAPFNWGSLVCVSMFLLRITFVLLHDFLPFNSVAARDTKYWYAPSCISVMLLPCI